MTLVRSSCLTKVGKKANTYNQFDNCGSGSIKSLPQSVTMHQPQNSCPRCSTPWQGPYCFQCGEKKLQAKDLSYSGFFGQLYLSISDIDNKFFKSFILLFTRPGLLTQQYMKGVRKSLLLPFQVFIFANIIYFFMDGFIGYSTFTTPLKYHVNSPNFIHQEMASSLVNEKLEKASVSFTDYESRFNRVVKIQAKSLLFISIPIFCFFLSLIQYRRRADNLVLHLVFSTHIITFIILIPVLIMPLVLSLLSLTNDLPWLGIKPYMHEALGSLVLFAIYITYIYHAIKRVYQQKPLVSLCKALLLGIAIYYTFLIYRMILFFTAFIAA